MELVACFFLAMGASALFGGAIFIAALDEAIKAHAKLEQANTEYRINQISNEAARQVARRSDEYLRTVHNTFEQMR